jgi:dolichol-phosphate mannosyltransferase
MMIDPSPAWIVVPTYNERENIGPLVVKISALGPYRILVVDDNSPDGTGELVESMQTQYPLLQLLKRPQKNGLGAAYRTALAFALDHGAQVVVHLDGDGSHPPELIPTLLQGLDTADLILASRYVAGGSMAIDPWRKFVSAIGNTYIRTLLGRDIRDWSTGYKAWRGDALRQVLNQQTTAVGYAWLMESTWQARRLKARIREVPLVFQPRRQGRSKFNWSIVTEDIRTAIMLYGRGR